MDKDLMIKTIEEALDGKDISEVGYETLKDLVNSCGTSIYARLESWRNSTTEETVQELNIFSKISADNQRQYEVCIEYDAFADYIDDIEDFISHIESREEEARNMRIVTE